MRAERFVKSVGGCCAIRPLENTADDCTRRCRICRLFLSRLDATARQTTGAILPDSLPTRTQTRRNRCRQRDFACRHTESTANAKLLYHNHLSGRFDGKSGVGRCIRRQQTDHSQRLRNCRRQNCRNIRTIRVRIRRFCVRARPIFDTRKHHRHILVCQRIAVPHRPIRRRSRKHSHIRHRKTTFARRTTANNHRPRHKHAGRRTSVVVRVFAAKHHRLRQRFAFCEPTRQHGVRRGIGQSQRNTPNRHAATTFRHRRRIGNPMRRFSHHRIWQSARRH